MSDYPARKSENLASDVILWYQGVPILRVSTASFEREDVTGSWTLLETWVFSNVKGIPSSQRIHEWRGNDYAVRFHNRLVKFLRTKYEAMFDGC